MPFIRPVKSGRGITAVLGRVTVRGYHATPAASAAFNNNKTISSVPAIPLDGPEAFRSYVMRCFATGNTMEPFRRAKSTASSGSSSDWKDWTPGPNSALKRPPPAKRAVIVGSGGLSIGQAGEFDYSGEPQICFVPGSLFSFLDKFTY